MTPEKQTFKCISSTEDVRLTTKTGLGCTHLAISIRGRSVMKVADIDVADMIRLSDWLRKAAVEVLEQEITKV